MAAKVLGFDKELRGQGRSIAFTELGEQTMVIVVRKGLATEQQLEKGAVPDPRGNDLPGYIR